MTIWSLFAPYLVIICPTLTSPPQTVGAVESLSKHIGWSLHTPGFIFYPDGKQKKIFEAKNGYLVKLEKCLDKLFFQGFGIIDLILKFFILEIQKKYRKYFNTSPNYI